MTYLAYYKSPLGNMTMASDGCSLTGLWFDNQKYALSTVGKDSVEEDALPVFEQTRQWLDVYFEGRDPGFLPPIRLSGSDFRQQVGRILLTIPYGQTMTYGEIAAQISLLTGKPCMSAQAVGGAVGHNPISVIVPCHRVVGTNGSLTGYAGGIALKVGLLRLEHTDMSRLFVPTRGTAI